MIVLSQHVTLLMASLLAQAVRVQSCDTGWFGEDCMYQCYCFGPCRIDGSCYSETCAGYHFGEACQSVDIVGNYASPATPSFLRDRLESTCNPNKSATSVEVILDQPFPFVWFRIHVYKEANILNFVTKINGGEFCKNERRFLGKGFVDVTCNDLQIFIIRLEIVGPIAPSVCSVYVSIGRNVALRQQVRQSTTAHRSNTQNGPSNAVDGRNSPYPRCSQTSVGDVNSRWALTYNRPQVLTFVNITGIHGDYDGINGISVTGLDENNSTVFLYQNYVHTLEIYQHLKLVQLPAVKYITIEANTYVALEDRALNLCEVATYGETVCPSGKHGLWCSATCSCKGSEVCSSVSGLCSRNCPPGRHGPDCKIKCSASCVDNLCNQYTSHCFECQPGVKGDLCDTVHGPRYVGDECMMHCSRHFFEDRCKDGWCLITCDRAVAECFCTNTSVGHVCSDCPAGRYGTGCSRVCPETCLHQSCNVTSADCKSCRENWAGPKCEECAPGKYGDNCSQHCPVNCKDQICHKETGDCVMCKVQFYGLKCKVCSHSYYGPLCVSVCSAHCLNDTCDSGNGTCPVCEEGYSGPFCDSIDFAFPPYLIIYAVLMAACSVILLISILWLQPHQRSQHVGQFPTVSRIRLHDYAVPRNVDSRNEMLKSEKLGKISPSEELKIRYFGSEVD